MNNSDVQEMLFLAIQARESGFPRIQADPADIIEVFEQRNELLDAIELAFSMAKIFHRDTDEVWASAKHIIESAINRAKGESK